MVIENVIASSAWDATSLKHHIGKGHHYFVDYLHPLFILEESLNFFFGFTHSVSRAITPSLCSSCHFPSLSRSIRSWKTKVKNVLRATFVLNFATQTTLEVWEHKGPPIWSG